MLLSQDLAPKGASRNQDEDNKNGLWGRDSAGPPSEGPTDDNWNTRGGLKAEGMPSVFSVCSECPRKILYFFLPILGVRACNSQVQTDGGMPSCTPISYIIGIN